MPMCVMTRRAGRRESMATKSPGGSDAESEDDEGQEVCKGQEAAGQVHAVHDETAARKGHFRRAEPKNGPFWRAYAP